MCIYIYIHCILYIYMLKIRYMWDIVRYCEIAFKKLAQTNIVYLAYLPKKKHFFWLGMKYVQQYHLKCSNMFQSIYFTSAYLKAVFFLAQVIQVFWPGHSPNFTIAPWDCALAEWGPVSPWSPATWCPGSTADHKSPFFRWRSPRAPFHLIFFRSKIYIYNYNYILIMYIYI